MNAKQLLIVGASVLASLVGGVGVAEQTPGRYVRIAQLEIDPARLEGFNAAAREEIEASIRVEPGVLVLYAVAEKDNPARILVFEMYADEAAYQAHLETPHFKKFKTATQEIVRSLKLVDATPIMLGTKAK